MPEDNFNLSFRFTTHIFLWHYSPIPQASTKWMHLLKRLNALHSLIYSMQCFKTAKAEEWNINTQKINMTLNNRLRYFHSNVWGIKSWGWIQAENAAVTCFWAKWATTNHNRHRAKHLCIKLQVVMVLHTSSCSSWVKWQAFGPVIFSMCVNVSWIQSDCAEELVPRWTRCDKSTGEVESSRNMHKGFFLAAVTKFVQSTA